MGSMSGDEFMEKPQDVGERILVSVRLRPLNGKEIARNDVSDWEGINDNTLIYRNAGTERSMYPSAYTFDRVFGCDSPTKKVYVEAAKEVALSVVSGINASIFAYGQTSSGKTYTMSGITEFAVEDIYEYIQRHEERTFVLKFSAMEIYNEAVRDLLSTDNTPLRLLDDPERGTVVDKLTEETLRDLDHLKELLELCEAQRQIGETSLNEMSSRSHQILRLSIESSTREFMGKDNCSTLAASVDFVDLAGSERASQTLSAGTRLKEGCHINRSLLTLGTVVRKLSKGRNGHIPYRDSKLTRILQCSLGGNARTAIICTISPARSHVEQSRNTLSFASCAKEVATSAQVNIVMSDKALVKHLQRELTRLESELGGLGSSSSASGSAALLKEKDLLIEKMEKEIKELILQRDLALSRLDNLEQAGDDQASELVEESSRYPQLRAPPTDESASSAVADRRYLNAGVKKSGRSHFSNGFIRSRSNEHPKQILEDHFLFDVSSPQFSTISPKFVGPDPYKGWEGIQGGRDEFEELCKDVRCIELEESAIRKTAISYAFTHEESEGMLPLTRSEDGTTKDQGFVSSPQKVDEDSDKVDAKFTYGGVEQEFQDVQKIIDCVPGEDLSSSRSLNLTRASSCDSAVVTGSSSPSHKADTNESTPSSGSEKDVSGKPQHIRRSSSTLNCIPKNSSMSRENSLTSERSDLTDDLKSHGIKNPTQDDVTSIHTFVSGLNEMTKLHCENKLDENQDQEKEPRTCGSEKTMKDVGLDPMQDSPLSWQLEFEGQQKEIIELWQTCHVSLIHRTYFFLLFKGDPSDSIYMEVERRRLSFLKDLYTRGNFDKIPVEGVPDLTPASSMKALRREREMLAKQMQKRLPEEEREKLYEKWGIGLKTKQRRLQLARRVWTDTKDMNHIRESAALVSNLLGLLEPKQGVKEMFILNFTPQKINRRSYSWKSS